MDHLFTTPHVSFVETILSNAGPRTGRKAIIELANGDEESSVLTWDELDRKARGVSSLVKQYAVPGDRILLVYESGLSFLPAFLGCLYAGTIAVPGPAPRRNQNAVRLRDIADDCGALLALTDTNLSLDIPVVSSCELADADVSPLHRAAPEDIALLQYTSGSTGAPRGVLVSHGNLCHNIQCIEAAYGMSGDSVAVTWLPFHHDMGLVGSLLYPLWRGARIVTMPPAAFLQQPRRWLAAIARFGGTHSAAPNFAYDLCARTVTGDGLDLSSWKVACNGAEPVREETLRKFSEAFGPFGFRREAFMPSYGLAESTLLVSAGDILTGDVRIVDPKTSGLRSDGEEGEIWVAGPSIASGYWGRPEETENTFCAHLAGNESLRYLRTGDLGFFYGGRLTVTGRLKDLIVIRGVNHYPHDIEATASNCHPSLAAGEAAAFSVDVDGEERLAIALEINREFRRNFDAAAIFQSVRRAVAQTHDVQVYAISLLRPHSLPKTTSGKIQRRACRTAFLGGGLRILAAWRLGEASAESPDPTGSGFDEAWLASRIAAAAGISASEIDRHRPFSDYAIDSKDAVRLSGEIEERLGRRVPPTVVYDYPTLALLARHLRERGSAGATTEERRSPARHEPIAIVGMGCRFPGAPNPAAFRQLLLEGREAVTEIPASRWDVARYYDPDFRAGSMYTKHGAFLEQVNGFDAEFFDITPREASALDPQQRLWLEVAWEALEDAGQSPARLAGTRTGVFSGQCFDDYMSLGLARGAEGIDAYTGLGSSRPATAGRLSYFLGLRGPSIHVDTSCSSSAVAVHLACQSLRTGECDLAMAGGVSLMLAPESTVALCQLRALARDGRSKTFDASADGYGRGEGCGIVVLKRLSDAIAAGDRIEAVIRSSATNHDGRTNGFTAPSGPAQVELIREALAGAQITPDEVAYIEAHGTGTLLGDPIEMGALAEVFGARAPERPLLVGSVKTNIGHLEGAAGIAGLIKAVIMVRDGEITPHLNLDKPNPHIDWNRIRVQVPQTRSAWPAWAPGRVAGVSSFGMSGMNAHIILENALENVHARPAPEGPPKHSLQVLTLSARHPEPLRELVRRYAALLNDGCDFVDICYTANTGRTHFRCRIAVVAENCEQMRQLLQIAALHQADGDAPQVRDADYRSPERLAQLYRQGAEIDWQRFYRGGIFRKLSLPTYPFQRRTYWLFERECGAAPLPVHPMLGKRLPQDRENNHIWESETDSDQFAYFAGHRIQGNMLMPLSGYIEMARAAVGEVLGVPVSKLANLQLHHPFLLPEKGARTVQIRVAQGNRDTTFHAASRAAGAPWVLHATATVRQET